MSLMSSLYVGVSGLTTSQNSLNTTSHNLANTETKGYVRQQIVQVDNTYLNWGTNHISTFQTGLGTDIEAVKQIRDVFLDKSYRKELGRQAFYESQNEAVGEIEGMFGELEGETFQGSIDKLWVSLQELAKEPDSIVTRASIIQNSVNFLERAENISSQLQNYQVNLNTQIKNQVSQINDKAQQIKTLNVKIRQYESNGMENANDLRDSRNKLLDELGKIINITYKETPEGVVTVSAEGVPLVSEDLVYKMGTAPISTDSDMLKPIWLDHSNADVFNLDKSTSVYRDTDIGSLKGLLVVRGSEPANYTDIPVRDNYNTDQEYSDAVYNYNNKVDTSVLMTVQAQFDQLVHGITTTINDILSPNKELTLTAGTKITYPDGTTTTLLSDQKITILDKANAPVGMDSDKTMGEALFNRKSMERYNSLTQVDILNADGLTYTTLTNVRQYNEEDPADNYSLFTIGEIEVNPKIMNNYSLIPLSSNTGSGDYDIKAAEALITKWQEPFATLSPNTLTSNNFTGYYTAFIAELANRGDQLNTISTNQDSMVNSIDNQRQQVLGVSSDEELTNLIKFQHAYNASARYITVIDSMLEHVIMSLGN
jgi:flagellar hook-associated protein 1 FlgK